MTPFRLILHHDYSGGKAIDLSGRGNHGFLKSPLTLEGRVPGTQALYFNGVSDRVMVSAPETPGGLGGIHVAAWIWVEDLAQRRNIIEGFLSFAMYAEMDRSLRAGTYNGRVWHNLWSPPNLFPFQEWVRTEYIYNGMDTSALYLNGQLVACEYAQRGSVQSVQWPFGLHIGAWPDADKYVFKGKIDEVKLWATEQAVGGDQLVRYPAARIGANTHWSGEVRGMPKRPGGPRSS